MPHDERQALYLIWKSMRMKLRSRRSSIGLFTVRYLACFCSDDSSTACIRQFDPNPFTNLIPRADYKSFQLSTLCKSRGECHSVLFISPFLSSCAMLPIVTLEDHDSLLVASTYLPRSVCRYFSFSRKKNVSLNYEFCLIPVRLASQGSCWF